MNDKGDADRIDKIFRLEKNNVQTAGALLRKNATGAYIAYATSDDICMLDKVEKQMNIFAENPTLRACFTWMNMLLRHDVYVVEEALVNMCWPPSGKNANASAINAESFARQINEEVYIVEDIIEKMDAEMFC